MRLNPYGHWELYVHGTAPERGLQIGQLSQHLLLDQEQYMFDFIESKGASERHLQFLKYFVAFFNRNLPDHIPIEYRAEILGLSESLPREFDFVGPAYMRALHYHAAHDIGHALQNMNLVACTSFGAWNQYSQNGSLIIGRNLDFYIGDAFAEEKIIAFLTPEQGYKAMFVTWPGMLGACSGMNEHGLCATINSAKSGIPLQTGTPIALLIREILQYAKTIDEALSIAKKRRVMVSETILIGSTNDGCAALIEVSPKGATLHEAKSGQLNCTNHFQSDRFTHTRRNKTSIAESSSVYRMQRLKQLEDSIGQLNPEKAALILRDRKGLYNADVGIGNELAINQLIAHHSVIFQPEQGLVWVSTNPFTLGTYVCYDVKATFQKGVVVSADSLNIAPDPWLISGGYARYVEHKILREKIEIATESLTADQVTPTELSAFKAGNPEFYYTYQVLGDYFAAMNQYDIAIEHYETGLKKQIPRLVDLEELKSRIEKAKKSLARS